MAFTGQVEAKGMLQPTGLPVIGMTMRPFAFRSCKAFSASFVMPPEVVRVSSMSVNTPTIFSRAEMGHDDKGFKGWFLRSFAN